MGDRCPVGVIHVIPPIPVCPVRPKSGRSANARVYEDTGLASAGKQLLPAATPPARGAATCPERWRQPADSTAHSISGGGDEIWVFRYSDLIVDNGCDMSNKAQQLLSPDRLYTASEIGIRPAADELRPGGWRRGRVGKFVNVRDFRIGMVITSILEV